MWSLPALKLRSTDMDTDWEKNAIETATVKTATPRASFCGPAS
jgi:hypothetical protein